MLIDLDKGIADLNEIEQYPFTLEEVVNGLSKITRFNGRTRNGKAPLDVLSHSMLVMAISNSIIAHKYKGEYASTFGTTEDYALTVAALLHDDHEYVIGDIATPVAGCLLGVGVLKARVSKAIKDRVLADVTDEFRAAVDSDVVRGIVRTADLVALFLEAKRLGFDPANYPDADINMNIFCDARGFMKIADTKVASPDMVCEAIRASMQPYRKDNADERTGEIK